MKMTSASSHKDIEKGMGTSTASRAFELESWAYVRHKDYQLHFMQKVHKRPSERPLIQTTEAQRLSFFRGYFSSPFKIQITYMQQMSYASFLWIYVVNVLFRSLPMNYLHSFLAVYNPDEHLMSSKMVPLCLGVSWQVLICSVLQLVASVDILSIFLDYAVKGLFQTVPWNRCPQLINPNPLMHSVKEYNYYCYNVTEFMSITKDAVFSTLNLDRSVHKVALNVYANYYTWENVTTNSNNNGPLFQSAPQSYFIRRWGSLNTLLAKKYKWIINYTLLWVFAAVFYKQLFKPYIWKLLNYMHLFLNLLYAVSGLYIIWYFLETETPVFEKLYSPEMLKICKELDYDMQAESIVGPPVVQLLSSRSGQQVTPGRDSFMITASNSMFYLFKGFVSYKMKSYVESRIRLPIHISSTNAYPIFNFWPWFLDSFFFASFAKRVFYVTTFIVEFLIFMITFQIVIEIIVCEWKWARRWIASVVLIVLGLTLNIVFKAETKTHLYVITTAISSLTEVIVICWIYPLDRLTDDIHFYQGSAARSARVWSLRLLPIYHIYKAYYLYSGISEFKERYKTVESYKLTLGYDYSATNWIWIISVVPLLLGAIYSIYKYVIKQRQNWRVLLRPRADWGPREHVIRQLRKQFDSREYVGSQASRYLSRHMLAKAQTDTYRLDIKYEDGIRHSTIVVEDNSFEDSRISLLK